MAREIQKWERASFFPRPTNGIFSVTRFGNLVLPWRLQLGYLSRSFAAWLQKWERASFFPASHHQLHQGVSRKSRCCGNRDTPLIQIVRPHTSLKAHMHAHPHIHKSTHPQKHTPTKAHIYKSTNPQQDTSTKAHNHRHTSTTEHCFKYAHCTLLHSVTTLILYDRNGK